MTAAALADLIESTADWFFLPWVVAVLLGTGLVLTVRTRFVQIRRFGDACRVAFVRTGSGSAGALTPFQAFMTSLAASIGTGNIAGVATAIVSGGPGALFWIWVYGFVAMAIKFAEAVLGVTYRDVIERSARNGARASEASLSEGPEGTAAKRRPGAPGGVRTGPMYYLRDGLRSPALAWTFALVAA